MTSSISVSARVFGVVVVLAAARVVQKLRFSARGGVHAVGVNGTYWSLKGGGET